MIIMPKIQKPAKKVDREAPKEKRKLINWLGNIETRFLFCMGCCYLEDKFGHQHEPQMGVKGRYSRITSKELWQWLSEHFKPEIRFAKGLYFEKHNKAATGRIMIDLFHQRMRQKMWYDNKIGPTFRTSEHPCYWDHNRPAFSGEWKSAVKFYNTTFHKHILEIK